MAVDDEPGQQVAEQTTDTVDGKEYGDFAGVSRGMPSAAVRMKV